MVQAECCTYQIYKENKAGREISSGKLEVSIMPECSLLKGVSQNVVEPLWSSNLFKDVLPIWKPRYLWYLSYMKYLKIFSLNNQRNHGKSPQYHILDTQWSRMCVCVRTYTKVCKPGSFSKFVLALLWSSDWILLQLSELKPNALASHTRITIQNPLLLWQVVNIGSLQNYLEMCVHIACILVKYLKHIRHSKDCTKPYKVHRLKIDEDHKRYNTHQFNITQSTVMGVPYFFNKTDVGYYEFTMYSL